MFWRKKEPEPLRLTLDEYNTVYAVIANKVIAMNEEARKHNMVEQGMLPQSHLSREDMLKYREQLDIAGRNALGKRLAGASDPDLTAREE